MRVNRLQSVSVWAGVAALALGTLTLVLGWLLGFEPARTLLPGAASMKANTAIGFVLCGGSLLLAMGPRPAPRLARGLGLAAGLIGAATLFEYVAGHRLGIDELLFTDPSSEKLPGRPAPLTAFVFIVAGAALALWDARSRPARAAYAGLVSVLTAAVLLALLTYAYGVEYLHGVSPVTGFAPHTALGFIFLLTGLVCARPESAAVRWVTAATPGGTVARRLVPASVAWIVVAGYVRVKLEQAGAIEAELGVALTVLTSCLVILAIAALASRYLDRLLARDEERLRAVLDTAPDAFVAIDPGGLIIDWNPAATGLLGWSRDEILGRRYAASLLPPEHREAFEDSLRGVVHAGAELPEVIELTARHRNGHYVPVEMTVGVGEDRLNAFVRDIAQRKELERRQAELLRKAERLSRTDDLTGLLNRRAFDDELGREIARARRSRDPLCVAMLDLDRFKQFNDAYGHQAGDRLLRTAAAAWRGQMRTTDVLARYGGEEFVVALPACELVAASSIVERMRAAMPEGETCSAGVAEWSRDETAEDLMRRADEALYAAKRGGRDRAVLAQ